MFELGILALGRAVADGVLGPDWELHGVGAVGRAGEPIDLGEGADLELLPRRGQDDYAELLRAHDVGLALMYTPHPSLVPIEMASAGMLTVTNSFENKTAEAMAAISRQPDRRRAQRRGDRRWAARRPRRASTTSGAAPRQRRQTGAATGTTRSTTS